LTDRTFAQMKLIRCFRQAFMLRGDYKHPQSIKMAKAFCHTNLSA